MMDRPDRAVRKGLRIERRRVQRGAVVPKTDGVLAGHRGSPGGVERMEGIVAPGEEACIIVVTVLQQRTKQSRL